MAHTFFINSKTKRTDKPVAAYFMVRLPNGKLVKVNSGIKALPADLLTIKASKSATTLPKELREVKDRIDDASDIIDQCVKAGMTSGAEIGAKIDSIVNADIISKVTSKSNLVLEYLRTFINDAETVGVARDDDENKTLSKSSICVYKELLQQLYDYDGINENTSFDAINKAWTKRFKTWLASESGKGLMPGTIKSLMGVLGRIWHTAKEDGVHNMKEGKKQFAVKAPKESDGETKTRIYLHEYTWEALYNMKDLTPFEEQVRDLVVWGYFSFQRFSDYSTVNKNKTVKDKDGKDVKMFTFEKGFPLLTLRQRKTGTLVHVPVLNPMAQSILKKYDYHFPAMGRSNVIRTLKVLLHRLADDENTPEEVRNELNKPHRTRLTSREKAAEAKGTKTYVHDDDNPVFVTKKTWELTATHVCRISRITNARKSHLWSDKQIMSVCGHLSLDMFNHYDNEEDSEIVDSIVEDAKRGPKMGIAM